MHVRCPKCQAVCDLMEGGYYGCCFCKLNFDIREGYRDMELAKLRQRLHLAKRLAESALQEIRLQVTV